MAKPITQISKRRKRRMDENGRNLAQEERIRRQIRKAERKDIIQSIIFIIVAIFLAGSIIYAGVTMIISAFSS